ncbi:MAG TPA: type I DNA topoisomerase, partial [Steroidobacteraceae bacterium]|nr:type I DNA topoisomerase [Steroidobacteraceae bacterium]
MSHNLVIVESPAKAKTIKKYLGKDFEVLASYGHVRDLVPKEGAVDPENQFAMRYQLIEKNEKHVQAISRAMKKADALYLATDPDREGEAISWHLLQVLKEQKMLEKKPVHRVAFYEITRNAIQEAIKNPRDVSNDLVNAQQARRALDYLVGFNISPLLWKKAGLPGASAGRVQSPALRLICEREEEILNFKPREYWTVDADVAREKQNFPARLIEYQGSKVEQFTVTNAEQAASVKQNIESAAQGKLIVANIDKKQRKRNPSPPFTTSTLQQEASRKLGFGAQRTMRIAQQLYEGVDFGEGAIGLITYMRTDSVNLAAEAVQEIRQVIGQLYGAKALPEEARAYKTKSKNAQEAHEAIRPTSAAITPDRLSGKIEPDLLKLYTLIWKRTLASQMAQAIYDTVAVDLNPGTKVSKAVATLRANGSTLVDPGYLAVYIEGTDDITEDDDDRILPAMNVGDVVQLAGIKTAQHF